MSTRTSNDQGENDQGGHGEAAEEFDAFGDAAVNDDEIEREGDDQEDDHLVVTPAQGQAILDRADEAGKKIAVVADLAAEVHLAGQVVIRVTEAPGLDVNVIHVDHHGDHRAEHADVLAGRVADQGVENAGTRIEPPLAGVTSQRPFRPADGNAQEDQRNEVGDHEGAAAILRRQAGEPQEIAEPDRAARQRP